MAALAAASGMAVIGQAMEAWVDDPATSLDVQLDRAFQAWVRLARATS